MFACYVLGSLLVPLPLPFLSLSVSLSLRSHVILDHAPPLFLLLSSGDPELKVDALTLSSGESGVLDESAALHCTRGDGRRRFGQR